MIPYYIQFFFKALEVKKKKKNYEGQEIKEMRKIEENSEYLECLLKGQLDKLGLGIRWLKSRFRPHIFSNYFLPVAMSKPSRE